MESQNLSIEISSHIRSAKQALLGLFLSIFLISWQIDLVWSERPSMFRFNGVKDRIFKGPLLGKHFYVDFGAQIFFLCFTAMQSIKPEGVPVCLKTS